MYDCVYIYIGVSKNRGTPKWMVYKFIRETPIRIDDLGVPLCLEIYIYIFLYLYTCILKLSPFHTMFAP